MKKAAILVSLVLAFGLVLFVGCNDPEPPERDNVTISIRSGAHGSVVSDVGEIVEKGTRVTLTVTPESGYEVQSLTLNDEEVSGEIADGKYSFLAESDTAVQASFSALRYTVTGKIVVPNGNYQGLSVTFLKGTQTVSATVDGEGNYTVRLEQGIYSVHVTHPEFEEVYRDGVSVTGDHTVEEITLKAYMMGDSPVAGAKANNEWEFRDGTYLSPGGRQDLIYDAGAHGREYIIQSEIKYLRSAGGVPRVGFVAGQDAEWITCISFNLVEPAADYLDLLRFRTDDLSAWEFTDFAWGFPLTGIRGNGLTLTVVRAGNDVSVYFDGSFIRTYEDHAYFHEKGDMAVGFFCDNAVVEFSNTKISTDLGDLEAFLKAAEKETASIGELFGDSMAGGVKSRGNWSGTEENVVSDEGRINTLYVRSEPATEYILQSRLTYLSGYGIPRPGLVIAQDKDWITCLSFNLVEPTIDWFGILRVNTAGSIWEYDEASYSVSDSKIRSNGVTVTVVRQGRHIRVYLEGVPVIDGDCKFLDDGTSTAAGLFTDCAAVRFENTVYERDLSKLDALMSGLEGWNDELQVPVRGVWTEDAGVYTTSDEGWKIVQKLNTTTFVASVDISYAAPGPGERPGLVIAANSAGLLAVVECDGHLGLTYRTAEGGWDVPAPYVPIEIHGGAFSLTVVREQSELYAFVNGNYIAKFEYNLPQYGGGAVGLHNVGCDATFRNLTFTDSRQEIDLWMSMVGGLPQVDDGGWEYNDTDGSYTNGSFGHGGYKVMETVSGSNYVLSARISVAGEISFGARPGLVVAANRTTVLAVCYFGNKLGLVARSLGNWNTDMAVLIENSQLDTARSVVLTVVRDGRDFYIFIDGSYLAQFTYRDCSLYAMNESGDGAYGFFNFDVPATFGEYSISTSESEIATWMSMVGGLPQVDDGGWEYNEANGTYTNGSLGHGGYKVMETVSGSKYVLSARISVAGEISFGARPGLVVAANRTTVLAVCYFGNKLGLVARSYGDWNTDMAVLIENSQLDTARSIVLTVVRDGRDFYIFIDGSYVSKFTYQDCGLYAMNGSGDGAYGFFNFDVPTTYGEYSISTSENDIATWMEKVPE